MACQYFESTENGAKNFTIALPKLTFGRGCLEEAGKRAKARKMTKVAVFTDRILSQLPYLHTLQNSLNEAGIDSAVFSEIQIAPSDLDVLSGANWGGLIYFWFPVMVSWLIKSLILKFSGWQTHKRLEPLFLGLVLGDYVPRSILSILSFVLNLYMPSSGAGHTL